MNDEKRFKYTIIKYAIACLVGALMVYIALSSRNFSFSMPKSEIYRHLCDAFTIPGMVFILIGFMIWLVGQGALSGLGYVVSYAMRMLIPRMADKYGRNETYAEYLDRKNEKGKPKGYGFLFFVGIVFMVVAIICLVLFFKYYDGP